MAKRDSRIELLVPYIVEYREEGKSYGEIGRIFDIPPSIVRNISVRYWGKGTALTAIEKHDKERRKAEALREPKKLFFSITELHQFNPICFEWLYKEYRTPLRYFSYKMINDWNETEDIVQLAFIKLFENVKTFSSIHAIRVFLYTLVRNAGIDYIRAQKRHAQSHKEIAATNTEIEAETLEVQARVLAIISDEMDRLPSQCRLVISKYKEGKQTQEIASEMRLSPRTVINQKTRGISFLKRALKRLELNMDIYNRIAY